MKYIDYAELRDHPMMREPFHGRSRLGWFDIEDQQVIAIVEEERRDGTWRRFTVPVRVEYEHGA